MKSFVTAIVTVFTMMSLPVGAVAADELLFDPTGSSWSQQADVEFNQWTHHLREGGTPARIDIVWSNDMPLTYVVRRPCSEPSEHHTFEYAFSLFSLGEDVGVGFNCEGETVSDATLKDLLSQVGGLPPEVLVTINQ